MSDQTESGGILKTAAKAVGAAAGKLASVAKVAKPEVSKPEAAKPEEGAPETAAPEASSAPTTTAPTPSAKVAKLPAKNKSRLPRKLKKSQKKSAEAALAKR